MTKSQGLQRVPLHVERNGQRHHVSLTVGGVLDPVPEALEQYLGFDVAVPLAPAASHLQRKAAVRGYNS